MYELEATAFRNFGITKFFFPSETLFNRSKPFSCSQPRTKLISSHLNSPSSLAPFWIQHTCLKEKFKFPTPKQIPHLPLEKKVKFPPSSNTKQANSPGMPGGGMSRFRFDSRITNTKHRPCISPPLYKPIKNRLQKYIRPGLIVGGLR